MEPTEEKYRDHIPWYGRPFWWPVFSGFGLLYFALYASMWIRIRQLITSIIGPHPDLADSAEVRQFFTIWNSPWIALAAGLLIGSATTGIMYFILRRTRNAQVESVILHPFHRWRWKLRWQAGLYVLPLPAVFLLVLLVFGTFKVMNPVPTQALFFAIWIPTGFLYFEHKQIYVEAQATLQSHKVDHDSSQQCSEDKLAVHG